MPPRPQSFEKIPNVVLAAVGVLSLLFLGGGIFLYSVGVFRAPLDVRVATFPKTLIAVRPYQGALPGLDKAALGLKHDLEVGGILYGQRLQVYANSPLKMRPIRVESMVAFTTRLGGELANPLGSFQMLELPERSMVCVTLAGQGVYRGMQAWRAAQNFASKERIRLIEGERYEIWVEVQGRPGMELWFPFQRE
jgi:hypothetical protein